MSTVATTERRDRPADRRIDVLVIGPWHLPEFVAATAPLDQWHCHRQVDSAEQAYQALLQVEVAPELIFLAQPLPGSVRQTEVDRLQQLAPLARIVVVASTWCEGELRTGQPPTGVLRLYWYDLARWWQAASGRLASGRFPPWSLPLDHVQAGRCCHDTPSIELPSVVAIDAEDYAVFESLAEAVRLTGSQAVWANGDKFSQASAGIWDGGQLSARERDRLREFSGTVAGNVVALLDFPRIEHVSQARDAGASAVFGKPYIVEEVLSALR